MNYYNENDPKAAAWLRELIKAGEIPDGWVDTRSIVEVSPHELTRFTQQHFFAGIGGWALALRLAGFPDGQPVRTASCPCQPFSQAGQQKGTKDERHLWPVCRDLLAFGEPAITFGEQVASPLGREWLAGVRADMEGLGYEVGAADLCAAGVGAPHIRQRLYWVAHAQGQRWHGAAGTAESAGRGIVETNGATGRMAHPGHNAGCPEQSEPLQVGSGRFGQSGALNSNGLEHTPGDGREQRRAEPSGRGVAGGCGDVRVCPICCASLIKAGLCAAGDICQGCPGWLGNPNGTGSQERQESEGRGAVGGEGEAVVAPGSVDSFGGMGVAQRAEEERLRKHCREILSKQKAARSGCPSPWSNFELVYCQDGKYRRIEPGTFPLAHGISGRVGLLRGYGNAIVPQVAALFIQASIEAINPLTQPCK